MNTTVAIDLGGTHIRVALVAEDGTILVRHRQRTPTQDSHPDIIPTMIGWALDQHGKLDRGDRPTRAVVGAPGIVDHDYGCLIQAPNLPTRWLPSMTQEWIAKRSGLEVSLANDADLAAVGESSFGAGRKHRDVVYVTISTGVGAGIVVGGRLVRGRYSGGELGHTIIDRMALAKGQPATVEDLGSGSALGEAAALAGIDAEGSELADLVRKGEPGAVEVWNETIAAVGLGIANLAWIVAPGVVVLGGGVGSNADLVVSIIDAEIQRHGPYRSSEIKVTTAALGDDAALAGAATWWEAIGHA